jgi:glycosyltransferase involved in cell wall biosynthesis
LRKSKLLKYCTLLISTYNWPEALSLCLESVLKQTILPLEIIIADDGSTDDTAELIEAFRKKSPVPVFHVWHPDEGFQLAKIRNRAIANASCPYIIQIDGDLILHRNFIKDHLRIREEGYFVSGSRVLLSQKTTRSLIEHNSIDIQKHYQGSKNFLNRFRSYPLRKLLSKKYKTSGKHKFYVKGCNMAFWKKDLLTVNGYNEIFKGWGNEDSELAIRLINADIKKKFLKMGGITYHMYHKEASRENEAENIKFMDETLQAKKKWSEKGLDQYLK